MDGEGTYVERAEQPLLRDWVEAFGAPAVVAQPYMVAINQPPNRTREVVIISGLEIEMNARSVSRTISSTGPYRAPRPPSARRSCSLADLGYSLVLPLTGVKMKEARQAYAVADGTQLRRRRGTLIGRNGSRV